MRPESVVCVSSEQENEKNNNDKWRDDYCALVNNKRQFLLSSSINNKYIGID